MLISVLRTCFLYAVLLFSVRLMGKRQISELQTSELVITLLMSNIATIPMQDTEQSMLSGLIPIMVLLVFEIFLSYLMLKSPKIRRIICGKPIIVINNGALDRKAMTELRLSTEDLFEQLRQKDIFDISEVAYAIVETNGMLSIMKKADCDFIRIKDMKLRKKENTLSVTVISDGKPAPGSLSICGMTKAQLDKILKKEKLRMQDVFIMTADKNGDYTIIRKDRS